MTLKKNIYLKICIKIIDAKNSYRYYFNFVGKLIERIT